MEKRWFILSFPGILKDEMNFTQDSLLYADLFQYSEYKTQNANSTRTSMCGGQSFPCGNELYKSIFGFEAEGNLNKFLFLLPLGLQRKL